MARIIATESVTLDGVMQGLGRADEDTRGGFTQGGWGEGYTDEVIGRRMGAGMSESGGMLFGRRTYDDVMRAWTTLLAPSPVTDHLLAADKFVVSRSPDTELPYPASTLLAGDAVETVRALKDQREGTLSIIGSGELVRTLHAAGLMDGYVVLIHPIVMGSGARLFGDGERRNLRLVDSVTSTTGVIVAEYAVEH
jgi:dihydrofolate reductase